MIPAAYCRPTPPEVAAAEREARWARSNPIELQKEIELMEGAGVAYNTVCHAKTTLRDMIEERARTYKA